MKSFYNKEIYQIDDIQLLIDNEVEESIYLDFKSCEALGKGDGKKKDISKDVASFANSDGGIIIYGVREENHKASSFSFVDGNEFTKEWLEHVINSSIQRRIEEVEIIPLRNRNEISQSIYIVKIPRSMDAPHLSSDKRFYKRFNFESVPMEEHEIRQLYGRKIKSKLVIENFGIRIVDSENEEKHNLLCEVSIYNDGNIFENNYKVNLIIENFISDMIISWEREKTNYGYTVLERGRVKLSANSIMPIFPNELLTVMRFSLLLPKNKYICLDDVKISIILFYSNGEDKMETNFLGIDSEIYPVIKNEQES